MSLTVDTNTVTLNNKTTIPAVALGTWQASTGEAKEAVKVALQNHYRHIDTAALYKNEAEVGEGIIESGIPREEIYLTTKLAVTDFFNVQEAFEESLKKLKVDYVDLYLMHWPYAVNQETQERIPCDFVDVYKEMQKLLKTGKVKSIGVSNFTKKKMERLLADPEVTVKPVVNQIELHPLLPQDEFIAWLKENDIQVEAYCPLGSSQANLIDNETIKTVAEKYHADPGQILVSWAVQRGTIVLPKSVTEHRIISNLKTVVLSDEDFETINNLHKKEGIKRVVNPKWNDFDD
ncbi:hypothetical protein PUMCH_001742 [Australozyma saopauloensis]|uniref:2-dehydropantolactone reductase n=1 Tax=Australozyma saopauloensis TaxID=291208 RepID=A0AAX4H7L4_9ASCO|nr:hypothetical protein PUMCH_001742 [[Candida] saopauloensis]